MEKELPVVFAPGSGGDGIENTKSIFVQNLLLRAMAGGITDPKQLQAITGLKKVTDVYITLDKLSLRKEYHAALARAGIDLDYLVSKLKASIDHNSPDISLKGIALLIKSLGLEKYEAENDNGSKPWEEIVLERSGIGETIDAEKVGQEEYEVKIPQVPEEIAKKRLAAAEEHKELYE